MEPWVVPLLGDVIPYFLETAETIQKDIQKGSVSQTVRICGIEILRSWTTSLTPKRREPGKNVTLGL
jgi:hypothetical protein